MRCSSGVYKLGPHYWRNSLSKKYIKLTVQNLRALVNYVEEGGVLNSHDDVPESVREKLYIQEQRLERQKGGTQSTSGYPPINITNVLHTHTSPSLDFLEILNLQNIAITRYSDWQ